jgi:outer membrane cobalamin receptor
LSAQQVRDRYIDNNLQEDYLVLGSSYDRVLSNGWKLQAQISNLLDEHYQTSANKSTPRRRVKIALSTEF